MFKHVCPLGCGIAVAFALKNMLSVVTFTSGTNAEPRMMYFLPPTRQSSHLKGDGSSCGPFRVPRGMVRRCEPA